MKKLLIYFTIVFIVLIFNHQVIKACQCGPIDLDEDYITNSFVFSGTVKEVHSKTEATLEVETIYNGRYIKNQLVNLDSITSETITCGFEFTTLEGTELFVIADKQNENRYLVNLCTIRGVVDGDINNISMGDDYYESISLDEIYQYMVTNYDEDLEAK